MNHADSANDRASVKGTAYHIASIPNAIGRTTMSGAKRTSVLTTEMIAETFSLEREVNSEEEYMFPPMKMNANEKIMAPWTVMAVTESELPAKMETTDSANSSITTKIVMDVPITKSIETRKISPTYIPCHWRRDGMT